MPPRSWYTLSKPSPWLFNSADARMNGDAFAAADLNVRGSSRHTKAKPGGTRYRRRRYPPTLAFGNPLADARGGFAWKPFERVRR